MASASGCSIAGHFTLHQSNASRHVENSMRRFSRLGAPVPERITRPPNSSYNTHLRRSPRSRPAIQQPSPPRDYQQRTLRRSERQVQRVQTLPGTSSRRREEASRCINVPLAQTQASSSRHARPAEPFPARRPHRTRYSPSGLQDKRYEGHRGTSVESFYDRTHEDCRSEYMKHRTLDSQSYAPPPARYPRAARPSAPATNRWSLSSDSSASSIEGPATPTSSVVHIPWSHSYMKEFAREFEHVQQQEVFHFQQEEFYFRRRLEMQEEMNRATKPSLLSRIGYRKPPVPVVPDDCNGQESLVDICPMYEEDDVGQTTVYANHEVIARDSRFSPSRQRTRDLDGVLVVQPSSISEPRHDDRSKPRSADETERKKKQQRRTAVFPMWAEPAPRDMQDKERDGIRLRFLGDPDESPLVSSARDATGYEEQPTITRRPTSSRHSSSGRDIRDTARRR